MHSEGKSKLKIEYEPKRKIEPKLEVKEEEKQSTKIKAIEYIIEF